MDIDRRRRNRRIKILVVEFLMMLGAILVLTILIAMANGWRINKNLNIEQNGLLQVESVPTDATVKIEKEPLFQKTNTSKMLMAGEYEVELSKEGYDGWNKKIRILPGWLSRIRGARLIKQDREMEQVREYSRLNFLSVSEDRENILYSTDDTFKWQLMSIKNDDIGISLIDVSKLLVSEATEEAKKSGKVNTDSEKFEGIVEDFLWSQDGSRVIVRLSNKGKKEYLMLDLRDHKKSLNLGMIVDKFNADKILKNSITKYDFMNRDKLIVLIGNELYEMDLESGEMDLVKEQVYNFLVKNEAIVYLGYDGEMSKISILSRSRNYDIKVFEYDSDLNTKIAISEYSNEYYLTVLVKNRLYVYKAKDILSLGNLDKQILIESDLSFYPTTDPIVSAHGQFILAQSENNMVVFSAESGRYYEYSQADGRIRFLDEFNLYEVENGALYIKDADGANRRLLVSENVGSEFDAVITVNDKWLYYVVQSNDKYSIRRERLID